jgi:transposase
MNQVLHIAAIVQPRNDTESRAYFRRKVTAGKTHMEALRCLKRRVSDVLYRRLVADAQRQDLDAQSRDLTGDGTGPGGHGGQLKNPTRPTCPHVDTSDKPLPGPHDRRYPDPSEPERPRHTRAHQLAS